MLLDQGHGHPSKMLLNPLIDCGPCCSRLFLRSLLGRARLVAFWFVYYNNQSATGALQEGARVLTMCVYTVPAKDTTYAKMAFNLQGAVKDLAKLPASGEIQHPLRRHQQAPERCAEVYHPRLWRRSAATMRKKAAAAAAPTSETSAAQCPCRSSLPPLCAPCPPPALPPLPPAPLLCCP